MNKNILQALLTIWIISLSIVTIYAQDIAGQWNGLLKVQGMEIRVVFHIEKTDDGYSTKMDSPDQGAKGIPTTSTTFETDTLKISLANAGIQYTGKFVSEQLIEGTFRQAGQNFPLNLSKEVVEVKKKTKPQEPIAPFPYHSEEVKFLNSAAGIHLAGTLTLPQKEGKFPAVILISGSGPQNRDEELLGHKPFLVISDFLTKNGIAVLRYDDRGTAESEGDFSTATTADFATDANAAFEYLKTRKEIIHTQIGLIGHSEGGMVAPLVSSQNKEVAFIILLAGLGIPGDELLLLQQKLVGQASGFPEDILSLNHQINKDVFDMIKSSKSEEEIHAYILKAFQDNPSLPIPEGLSVEDFVKIQVKQIVSPWMQYFVKYDPKPVLAKVKCPVLALNGQKDLQVPYQENLQGIQNSLKKAKNKNVKVKEYVDLNHLFQECETGSPAEYAQIEQTFSPIVMKDMLEWIKCILKK